MVFLNLSIRDICNLRMTLRTLAMTQFPDSFWGSRFWAHHEYGFFAPALTGIKAPNYKTICYHLRNRSMSKRLQNRKRIWQLALGIADLICIARSSSLAGTPLDHQAAQLLGITCVLPEDSENDGCRQLHRVNVIFPTTLDFRALGVSFVVIVGQRVVSGFRIGFSTLSGKVGYIHAGSETILHGPSGEGPKFLGLQVALDCQGIRAVALDVIGALEWAGNPAAGSRGRVLSNHLLGLCIGLDVRSKAAPMHTPQTDL
jgi:hypothetical protein